MKTVKNSAAPRTSRERFGALFFFVLLFFIDYYAFPVSWVPGLHLIHPGKIVGAGILLALLLNINSLGEAMLPDVVLLLLLLVQMSLSSMLSPVWKGKAVSATINFSQVFLVVFAMALAVRTLPRLRKLVFVQTGSISIIALFSLASGVLYGGRLTAALSNSIYSNANDLALAVVLTIPFGFYFLFHTRSALRRTAWAVILLLMCATVLKTGSRAGFMALVIAVTMCLWQYGIKGRRIALVLVTVVAALAVFAIAGSRVEDRLNGTFNQKENYESAHGSYEARRALLIESLHITAQHPLFGVGVQDFPAASKMWNQTHNIYTTFSAETGLPGLIIFLLLFGRAFKNIREVRRRSPDSDLAELAESMRASLLAFALAGFFFPDAYMFFTYMMFALTTAAFQISRDQGVEVHAPEIVTQKTGAPPHGVRITADPRPALR